MRHFQKIVFLERILFSLKSDEETSARTKNVRAFAQGSNPKLQSQADTQFASTDFSKWGLILGSKVLPALEK